jgi:threonine aldolase
MIDKVRKLRKSIGGGLRQAGILAAAGVVALKEMIEPLKDDHRIAKYIGEELSKIKYIKVETDFLEANMVFFTIDSPKVQAPELIKYLHSKGIKMNEPYEPFFNYRIAVHHYIREPEANKILESIR